MMHVCVRERGERERERDNESRNSRVKKKGARKVQPKDGCRVIATHSSIPSIKGLSGRLYIPPHSPPAREGSVIIR